MQNNYDPIARYYDVLSRLVYFRAQLRAQTDQLHLIPANSKILIAGGGTGWILEEISKIRPEGLEITYIEISEKMLQLSGKRDVKANHVTYIHAAAEDFKTSESYDVIITAFLFDNFSKDKISIVFDILNNTLREKGLWLFSDFYYTASEGKLWQKLMLKAMYFFFRCISKVETNTLINTEAMFQQHHYHQMQVKKYYSGFIKSIVYQKS
ncbi:methyltransferase domain-containing protein [Pedobacter sp. MC2016-15]|uniref:methyltransferase domain-containing protein n=1 Tax=Pedobacter sp. MC2016-15 TaxID=2994473 RepID=UPI002246B482|nr:methyltransferase domain-containing protein [Pedobacter sp. MC2016-15]MCX2477831.1 methyltransferase domain-containing protein [Pedobacter sp. MC2016-15]